MNRNWQISRRTVLRGLGATMALPLLDVMSPTAAAEVVKGAAGAATTAAPLRSAFFFLPNGMCMEDFTPRQLGQLILPPSLAPFEKVKNQMTVVSGLALDNAWAKGDGPGDHARSAAAFLTGAHPYKTSGANIKLGVSVDQIMAEKIGNRTRLPSLELGLDKGAQAGNCDSGYSCAYVSNISWRSDTTPMPKEIDPAALFDRLFGTAGDSVALESRDKRYRLRKSILDSVADDAARLNRSVSSADQRKLDEFMTAIRDIERRIEAAKNQTVDIKPPGDTLRPDGIPGDIAEHFKLMSDLLVLAFQMDITRISTFMVARDGSDRLYRNVGATEGHHTLSHHGGDKRKMDQIRKIDLFHLQQFAYFIEKLGSIKEGNSTLLDNSLIMIGSGIGDGNRHNHDELPVLLAGRGGGAVTPGRHVRAPRNTPMCNLYLSMMGAMGVDSTRFGDSTGKLGMLKA